MSRLIDIASAEIGTKEIEGRKHNQRIIEYAHEVGFDWVESDETPWCSIFLNWVTYKAGYTRSEDARSKSWRNVGDAVQDPQPGDVILFGSKGNINAIYHVGIFTGFSEDGRKVFCLGGNQTDAVSISKMWCSEVAGYRRLEPTGSVIDMTKDTPEDTTQEAENTTKPQETTETKALSESKKQTPQKSSDHDGKPLVLYSLRLRLGSKGEEVTALQRALNRAGYDCGTPDGIFGKNTQRAVVLLQFDAKIRTTGKTNRKTRNYLAELLNIQVKPRTLKSILRRSFFGRK